MKEFSIIKTFILKQGKYALNALDNLQINTKSDGVDLVTNIDKHIESEFYKLVTKYYPAYGFLGEEFTELNHILEYTWTIDPIDGTKFFAKQVPMWCISIALLRENKPIYGLIYNPISNQLYEAQEGKGCFLNDQKLTLKLSKDISKIQLAWDTPILNAMPDKDKSNVFKLNNELNKVFYRVRNFGTGALSLCWLAQNFLGAFVKVYQGEKQRLDNLAGIIIAQEAGAIVYEGIYRDYEYIIVANSGIINETKEIVNKFLNIKK